jgi:GntR family transcriptional repressor for pyruvate dehydrogenase complex
MKIQKIKPKRVSDQVLEQMKRQIIDGYWKSGEKIPGEIELTQLFDVSRVSIREAIHRLVGMGVLTIKRGEGTFVSEVLPKDIFHMLLPLLMVNKADLRQVLEFRSIIEVESAKLAADRRTSEDLKELSVVIDKMKETKNDLEEFAKWDLEFHTVIAKSTKNDIITKIHEILIDLLQNAMNQIVVKTGVEHGLFYHQKIFEAIYAKNEQSAEVWMRKHIVSTREIVE